ncbi:MAG: trypsin-like peptidase domain-containing protein [Actinomycetota bacterium]|nr:trypsin-like peptidase domain-containing protein [Actinomycetota bacterium]
MTDSDPYAAPRPAAQGGAGAPSADAPWWSRPGEGSAAGAPPGEPPAYADTARFDEPPRFGDPAPAGPASYGVPGGWGSPPDTIGQPPRNGGGTGWLRLLAVALVAALVGGGIGAYAGITAAGGTKKTVLNSNASLGAGGIPTPVDTRPGSVASIAAKLLPSVVSIQVTAGTAQGTGSGVVIRNDGYIMTNNHVVSQAADNAGSIKVTFNDGKSVPATIVGRDPTSDLAVIKVDNVSGLAPATLGKSSSLVVGDPVVAIGSPLGLAGTVTSGIVSALDRPVRAGGESTSDTNAVIDAIQTDAAINPGNSGGPLVDSQAQVVGVNSAIASLGSGLGGGQSGSIGVGFAIPIDQARSIAEELIRTGKATHPYIGVRAQTVSETQAKSTPGGQPGALIREIVAGGPAANGGLQVGDVITKINDTPVTSVDDLIVNIRKNKIGDRLSIGYLRNGKAATAQITLQSDTASK